MFFYFFDEYKETVYKGARRKLYWYERFIIIVICITIACVILFSFLQMKMLTGITSILTILLALLLYAIECHYQKKNRNLLLQGHKEKHIAPLSQLIKAYGLYTIEGIDWLIECCKEKKDRTKILASVMSVRIFFTSFIYPLITLAIGLALKDTFLNGIIDFLAFTIAVFIGVSLAILFFRPLLSALMFPDEEIVEYLEDDLKYIKTQLKIN